MGTTLCALALVVSGDQDRLAIANVGDSRIYVYAGDEFEQLTEDHSLVAQLVRDGTLTASQADRHPQRNVLTRALGIDPEVNVDAWEVLPFAGDRFVLCSDGLSNELTDDQIAAVLRRLAEPQEAANELVRLANDNGGRDNITVVVVDIMGDERTDGVAVSATKQRVPDMAGFETALDHETVDGPTVRCGRRRTGGPCQPGDTRASAPDLHRADRAVPLRGRARVARRGRCRVLDRPAHVLRGIQRLRTRSSSIAVGPAGCCGSIPPKPKSRAICTAHRSPSRWWRRSKRAMT